MWIEGFILSFLCSMDSKDYLSFGVISNDGVSDVILLSFSNVAYTHDQYKRNFLYFWKGSSCLVCTYE